jgi:thioredoxin-dependent peroxiredoxin
MRLALLSLLAPVLLASISGAADKPPAVGDTTPDFTLTDLGGHEVQLAKLKERGPVVLVVLRGYPGYQCPACSAQVGDFTSRAKQFAAAKASVVLVYPGKAGGLDERAKEFMGKSTLPAGFHLAIDADYALTHQYGLRWEKEGETAYPATFVIDGEGKVRFVKVSRTHGDRVKATTVLAELKKL